MTIDNQRVTTETVTPMQQAAYTVRVNMAAARYDIPRVYHMFVLDSDDYNGGWFGPGPGHEPRLVAVAMRQVIDLLAGATNLEMVLDGAQDKPTDPFAYRFTTPRGTVLVAWCQVAARFTLAPSQAPGRWSPTCRATSCHHRGRVLRCGTVGGTHLLALDAALGGADHLGSPVTSADPLRPASRFASITRSASSRGCPMRNANAPTPTAATEPTPSTTASRPVTRTATVR